MSEASRRAVEEIEDLIRNGNVDGRTPEIVLNEYAARAVEGERAKFREYVDEMCECPLFIRNRAALRAPAHVCGKDCRPQGAPGERT